MGKKTHFCNFWRENSNALKFLFLYSHFQLGSLIQLATGELKRVENLSTEDFLRSAKTSSEVKIDQSVVTSIDLHVERGVASIAFLVGQEKVQVRFTFTLLSFTINEVKAF